MATAKNERQDKHMNRKLFYEEPYRILFCIGLLHLVRGALVWILFVAQLIPYPLETHARSMAEGFLLSFALGFLMTAIPRFSNTKPASLFETSLACILGVLSGFYDFAALFGLILLISFGFRRGVFSHKIKKPPFFIFIQGGLILGLAGISVRCFLPESFYVCRVWIYEGMMFLWLCGIGSRILVMLLSAESPLLSRKQNLTVFATLFFSFLFQPYFPDALFFFEFARSLAVTFLCFRVWEIHHLPFKRGTLAWSVWFGVTFFMLGQWTKTFLPIYSVHALHLIFIGAFCLLALMVSVRVGIAHSGEDLETEKKQPRLIIVALLLLLTALTRFSAGLMPAIYLHHLLYAAITLLIAIPIWASIVVPRFFKTPIENENFKDIRN